jgi:hypothetical protein
MKASMPFAIGATAAFLALSSAPLVAQETAAPANSSANAVGPAQLRDFSLEGTVIRRSEPPAAPAEPAPERQRQRTAAAPPAPRESSPAQRQQAASTAGRQTQVVRESAPAAEPAAGAGEPALGDSATAALPPLSPADPLFSSVPVLPGAAELPSEGESDRLAGSALPEDGLPILPWLIAILLFGGGAAYFIHRQRSALAVAGSAGVSEFLAPNPSPGQSEPKPSPAPAPRHGPKPVGIITTSLRPALELQFIPGRLILGEDAATIEFDLIVGNSGSGPARDVTIQAVMVNAGADQDQLLSDFFKQPPAVRQPIAAIMPLSRLPLRSSVVMPRAQLREFSAGDRQVFVLVLAFKAHYRWSGGDVQLAKSFLIGRDSAGGKLAPFRVDQGARVFGDLAARELAGPSEPSRSASAASSARAGPSTLNAPGPANTR